jgi:hypothetical protein
LQLDCSWIAVGLPSNIGRKELGIPIANLLWASSKLGETK